MVTTRLEVTSAGKRCGGGRNREAGQMDGQTHGQTGRQTDRAALQQKVNANGGKIRVGIKC